MGNVKVEAKHYEQAIEDYFDLPMDDQRMSAWAALKWVQEHARELAHAEQEKQE